MSTPAEQQTTPPAGVPTPKEVAEKVTPPNPPAQGQGQQTPDPDTFPRDYVHQLREEAKGYRTQLQTTQQQLDELAAWKAEQERAALSEEERRTLEFTEAQQRAEQEAARAAEFQLQYEVALRAGRLGIQDPSDAVRLLDWDALQFNENGDVTNMDDVLNALVQAKPYLRGQVQPITTHVSGNPSAERAPGAELTIEQIRAMRPEEINARWAEIEPILAAQGR